MPSKLFFVPAFEDSVVFLQEHLTCPEFISGL